MQKKARSELERFHYCLSMEMATKQYFGHNKSTSRWEAASFLNPKNFRESCLAIMKKLLKRVQDISSCDAPLRAMLATDLETLERDIKMVSAKYNNDMDIVADLFILIAHLLGWGKIEEGFQRTPVYYQTQEQRETSLKSLACLNDPSNLFEAYQRRKLILNLSGQGMTDAQIAVILKVTLSEVTSLKANDRIDELYHRNQRQ